MNKLLTISALYICLVEVSFSFVFLLPYLIIFRGKDIINYIIHSCPLRTSLFQGAGTLFELQALHCYWERPIGLTLLDAIRYYATSNQLEDVTVESDNQGNL